MPNIILIFLSLLMISMVNAKEINYSPLKKYHTTINQAEIFITENKLQEAKEVFESIEIEQFFLKDLFNFYLVNLELGDTSKAMDLCEKMAAKGIPAAFYKKSSFDDFRNEAEFHKIVNISNENYLQNQVKNKEYLRILDSLYDLDQSVFKYRNDQQLFNYFPDSLATINDNNMYAFLDLIQKYGLPDERILGPVFKDDTLISSYSKYIVIPIHCLQMTRNRELRNKCNETFQKAMFDGILDIHSINSFQELATLDQSGNLGYKYFALYNNDFYYASSYSSSMKTSINEFRLLYNLCSLDDMRKKILFKVTPNGKKYRMDITCSYFPTRATTREDFEKFSERYVLLKED